MINYKEKLAEINTFIFDIDGVLTDGSVITIDSMLQLRSTNVKDGYAMNRAIKKGYNVAVISAGKGQGLKERMEHLGLSDIFINVHYKLDVFLQYLQDKQITKNNVLYMGDDIPDYEIMQQVGIAACPADAAKEIIALSHYISHLKGGNGCARDVIEQVMRARGDWFTEDSFRVY